MPSRPRTLLKRALHTGMLTASLAASAAFASARPQQAPIAPQPFTTLPVRKVPEPNVNGQTRQMLDSTQAVTRALTSGEARLLAQLFGNGIDLSALRITFDSGNSAPETSLPLEVRVRDVRQFSADYSNEANPFIFGAFIHQVTAVVQQQSGVAWAAAQGSGNLYELDGRAFSAYSHAQQRALMEDYALRFLHPARQSYWLHKVYGGDKSTTDPYLIAAVEGAFPTATLARKGFERMILRGLTDGEKQLVHSIFGDQVDTSIIWIHLSPLAYTDVAGAVASSTEVYFYGHNRSTDFSREDMGKLSTFIHEMVHIWQFQTQRRHTVVVNDLYKYTIEPNARYEQFNIEQQAAMMEDYFLYFTHPDKKTRWLSQSYAAADIDQRMQYVIAAVEGHFPGARILRTVHAHQQGLLNAGAPRDPHQVKHADVFDSAPHTPELPHVMALPKADPVTPEPLPPSDEKPKLMPIERMRIDPPVI